MTSFTHYGDFFFDELRRELLHKSLAPVAEQWWRAFPHVPNDQGVTRYIQTLQKLVWTKGRKWEFELRQNTDQPVTLYCNWYNLDGTKVLLSLPVGIDLYTLMVQGEQAFLAAMDAVLMHVSES